MALSIGGSDTIDRIVMISRPRPPRRICAASAAGSVERAREKAPNQVSVDAGGADGHAHEHCGVIAVAPASASPVASLRVLQRLPAAELLSAAVGARAAHVGIELLLYAPKLAPPLGAASLRSL